jgi:hypothetical protein
MHDLCSILIYYVCEQLALGLIKDKLAIQVIITVLFAFIKKRVHLAPNCCNGRPGILVYDTYIMTHNIITVPSRKRAH